jgi:hypothetical protein
MCGEPFISGEWASVLRDLAAELEMEHVSAWLPPADPPVPAPPRGAELRALVRAAGGLK